MTEVVVVIGPGSIGQAIARRISAGKHVVLADLRQANADTAAATMRLAAPASDSDIGRPDHVQVVAAAGRLTRPSTMPTIHPTSRP